MKNGLFIAVGIFVLLIARMSFAGNPEYRHIKQDPKDIAINELTKNANEIKANLINAEYNKNLEIEKVKNDMVMEITRVKKEDAKVESTINAINKHLRGKLARKGDMFYYAGSLYNVNPMLLAAISIHETGNGSSDAVHNKNNVGGIMADSNLGILKGFEDVDISIVEMARILKKYYIDVGLKDIDSIGGKYCPEFATNDPTGLNKYWIRNVTEYYQQIEKDIV